jgi:WD40 repeat protein
MIYNKHNFDNISEQIEHLENKLDDLVQCLAQGYYPTKLVSAVRVTRALDLKQINSVKVSSAELVEVYNHVPNILINNAITVAVSQTTENNRETIYLEKIARGEYWIIATEIDNREYWLLPNGEISFDRLSKKLFNRYSIQTAKLLFKLPEEIPEETQDLILIQPAKVDFMPNGQTWKLTEPGIIEFGINDRTYQFKTLHQQLKTLTAEIDRLKSALNSVELTPEILPPKTIEIEPVIEWQNIKLIHNLTGHTNSIRSLAIANWQDNKERSIIISSSFDETIKIWDLDRGELIKTLNPTGKINAIAVTPNGKKIICGKDNGQIEIWDISTAVKTTINAHSHLVLALAVTPDGKTIISGSRDHTIKFWDLATRNIEEYLSDDYGTILALAISSDGRVLVSSTGDNVVRRWELPTGKLLPINFIHPDLVWSVAISPNGQNLVCGCRDRTIKIWDMVTGKIKHNLTHHTAEVWSVAISPDGQTLSSGSGDKKIALWNLETGELIYSREEHSDAIYAVAFSPDDRYLITTGRDLSIKVWQPCK